MTIHHERRADMLILDSGPQDPGDYGTCGKSLVLVTRKAIVSKDWTVNSTHSTGRIVNREGNVPNSSPQTIRLKGKCLRVLK